MLPNFNYPEAALEAGKCGGRLRREKLCGRVANDLSVRPSLIGIVHAIRVIFL